MAVIRSLSFLSIFFAAASAQGTISPNANAFSIVFSSNASIGPDGPWWYIPQAIDYPNQIVNMIPGLTQLSLAIAESACSSQVATCPLPIPTLWQESGAWDVSGGPQTISTAVNGSQFDQYTSQLLGLQGTGKFFQQRITLYENGVSTSDAFLDNQGIMLSESYKVTYPGGAEYTLDTGILSLYGGQNTISWKSGANGSLVELNRTLPDAYLAGYIPSISYGLHVGSATHNVTGSLIVGGYDSSRCITDPIVSDSTSVQLTKVALEVVSGGSAYIDSPSSSTNLLQENGNTISNLEVYPEPAVPYMYLPKDTCDAIAAHLPVKYSEDFGLYLWNTDDSAYDQIISSPHSIAFTFSSNGDFSTINIPFALLNLTLEAPLVSSPTPYFPCSPWTSTDAPYHLGRAFLQGAFLAQNWQTNKLFLGQAPGPDLDALPPYVKNIASSDSALTPATNAPSWDETWSTLKPLPVNATSSSSSETSTGSGLSGGAIAGIVVGIIVIIALLAGALARLILRRRRNDQKHATASLYHQQESYAYKKEQLYQQVHEADLGAPRSEMEARHLGELPSDNHAK